MEYGGQHVCSAGTRAEEPQSLSFPHQTGLTRPHSQEKTCTNMSLLWTIQVCLSRCKAQIHVTHMFYLAFFSTPKWDRPMVNGGPRGRHHSSASEAGGATCKKSKSMSSKAQLARLERAEKRAQQKTVNLTLTDLLHLTDLY